jgi:hypothetical protein
MIWLFSLPCLAALVVEHAIHSHVQATYNRLDDVTTLGVVGLVILVWACYVTEAIASVLAVFLVVTQSSSIITKLHALLVALAGWIILYQVVHFRGTT